MKTSFSFRAAEALTVLAYLLVPSAAAADTPWRYVVPSPGDPDEHPPLRVLALSSQKPEDLKESVSYRGSRQRYTQLRYGSPRSVRVAVVLDEISATEVDLYVDADRNRVIEAKDRVHGTDGTWRLPLDAAVAQGNTLRLLRRTVIFRLGRVGRTLSYATCGFVEGKGQLGDATVAVRRVDGDGNGFFADAQDRLWIDLDQDGRWDPLREQFLMAPILQLGASRYAVRADALGERLTFARLEGTGTVRLAVKAPGLAERIQELTATLLGRDGSVVTLHGRDAEATLPVGDYRLSVLTLTLTGPEGGEAWNYVFADSGEENPYTWYKLAKGGRQAIDPIGKVVLRTGLADDETTCRPGQTLGVQPQLLTGDGLLINTVYRGPQEDRAGHGGPQAGVVLATLAGNTLASRGSGFS
jgi:hypothetical protein